nr:glycine cleavage T C-terminal barrel domain-containing protein [Pyrinomonadaceae bacterium]
KYEFFSITNYELPITNAINFGNDVFIPKDSIENFKNDLKEAIEITDELYEVLRIEQGIPLYGVDMDETTIVPELGLPELISYKKGCYIGQEIIARIHFRGHIAKQLTGLEVESRESRVESQELKSLEGKSAGRITSVAFSPKLGKTIALAYVRYEFLAEGTELKIGEITATVKNFPFIG